MSVATKRRRLTAWLHGNGLEIGALHRPLEVPAGARVTYVDRLPVEELRRHYPELAELPLVPVDILGSAEDLSAVADASQDFVIANHLLEHLEDPIRGLREFFRILKPDGIVYMALPDQRQTFDRDRQLTTVDHLLTEYREASAAANRWDHYRDWALNVDHKDEAHGRRLMDEGYSIHFHVWRPDTFLDFLVAARREAGLDFELLAFAPPETPDDDEFVLVLAKGRRDQVRVPPEAARLGGPEAETPAPAPSPVRSALRRLARRR